MKRCFKCGQEKPLNHFYQHAQMADGHLNKCKSCTKLDVKQHRDTNIEKVRAYDRGRSNLPHRIKQRNEVAERWRNDPKLKNRISLKGREWRNRNTLKRAAHIIVGNAVREGELIERPCEVCGATKRVHAHHDDYRKPLDVRWLCHKHHMEHHRLERERNRMLI